MASIIPNQPWGLLPGEAQETVLGDTDMIELILFRTLPPAPWALVESDRVSYRSCGNHVPVRPTWHLLSETRARNREDLRLLLMIRACTCRAFALGTQSLLPQLGGCVVSLQSATRNTRFGVRLLVERFALDYGGLHPDCDSRLVCSVIKRTARCMTDSQLSSAMQHGCALVRATAVRHSVDKAGVAVREGLIVVVRSLKEDASSHVRQIAERVCTQMTLEATRKSVESLSLAPARA